jgi:chromosome segregation ATPase
MKERLETATEERDRAEDEASMVSRKKAREIEELKGKLRDAERSLKRVEDDKEELESGQKEWKRRRQELEANAERSSQELNEVRQAMGQLRDALDESERQARELELQKADLARSAEEAKHRLEKVQKSNKVGRRRRRSLIAMTNQNKAMADELRSLQNAKTKAMDSEAQSSRSSTDSAPSRARLGSPAPKSRLNSIAASDGSNGPGGANMDYIYLKNVLLQFLEQKDKKHQMQLIPVLGMLLHFDRKDEQKWMAAIAAK